MACLLAKFSTRVLWISEIPKGGYRGSFHQQLFFPVHQISSSSLIVLVPPALDSAITCVRVTLPAVFT